MQCCPLSNDFDDGPKFYHTTTPISRVERQCCECKEIIPVKTRYERVDGCWDMGFQTYVTCWSCSEIRRHFACGKGWTFERLWEDLEFSFFPGMRAGGPCMEGLSPKNKARLFERRLAWLENLSLGRRESAGVSPV